jgi:hypothetical protein
MIKMFHIVRVVSEHPLTIERVVPVFDGQFVTGYASLERAKEDLKRLSRQHGGFLYVIAEEVELEID